MTTKLEQAIERGNNWYSIAVVLGIILFFVCCFFVQGLEEGNKLIIKHNNYVAQVECPKQTYELKIENFTLCRDMGKLIWVSINLNYGKPSSWKSYCYDYKNFTKGFYNQTSGKITCQGEPTPCRRTCIGFEAEYCGTPCQYLKNQDYMPEELIK